LNKVLLKVGKVWTYVIADSVIVNRIDYGLSVLVPSRFYSPAYKEGRWDGRFRFYDRRLRRFLTGFLDEVLNMLYDCSVEIDEVEKGSIPEKIEIDAVELYGDFDKERWNKVQFPLLKEMVRKGRAVVRLATGGGKTEIIAGIAKVYSDKKILVLVNRMELLHQTIDRLKQRLKEEVGYIHGDVVESRVMVGMVNTVWNRRAKLKDFLSSVDVVISDECHRMTAKIWSKVLESVDAPYRFALSGTPLKGDVIRDKMLVGLTGPVIEGMGVMDLVEEGYAVFPEVKLIDTVSVLGKYNLMGMRYNDVCDAVYSDIRLWGLLKELVRWHGKSGLVVFTERVQICLGLYENLSVMGNGLKVGISYGGLSKKDRLLVLEKFKNREIDVLVTTTVLDEGVDVSAISGVVFMCSNVSIVRILQRIGRGVRREEGKDSVSIYDFVIDAPYLKKHVMSRARLYSKERFGCSLWKYHGGSFGRI